MQSMKNLVDKQGMTICSVIHQPRKFIFGLFDSLILLGVGGHLVYHGKVTKVEKYFTKLNYDLPPGESLAGTLVGSIRDQKLSLAPKRSDSVAIWFVSVRISAH